MTSMFNADAAMGQWQVIRAPGADWALVLLFAWEHQPMGWKSVAILHGLPEVM